MSIEKNIFQTWKDPEHVPEGCQVHVNKWRKLADSAGFRYTMLDDQAMSGFIQRQYPHHFPYFQKLDSMVEKTDYWRYLTVYHYGGYYADIDCEFNEAFVTVSEKTQKAVVQVENGDWFEHTRAFCQLPEIAQFFFGFPKGAPLLMAVIEEINRRIEQRPYRHLGPFQEVLFTTGPGVFGHVVYAQREQCEIFRKNQLVRHHFRGGWADELDRGPHRWVFRRGRIPYSRLLQN